MRRSILLLALVIAGFRVSAQEPVLIFEDTLNDKDLIKLTSFNTYSSNRFSNEFMDKFIFGGTIDTELKDKISGKLNNRNVIGAEAEQRIESFTPGINLFGKEHYGLKLSFSDNHYASANISTDLFNTAMYGNGPYVGDSMNFAFSSFHYQHYQKLGVGFYNEKNMSSVTINYVAGSKGTRAGLNETWLYTHTNEDSIDISSSGDMFITERFYPYWAFLGSGFSVDLDFNFIFEGKVKNRQIINFKMNNLGMIIWNKSTKNYVFQTDATYSGFDVQDLLNDSTATEVDWMDTLGVTETIGRRVDVMPLELIVQKLPDNGIDAKWQPIYGFKAIMIPEYFPYLYGGVYYHPVENFSVSTRVSYGGFAGIRWGLNLNYWIKDKAYIGLGTFDMIGLASKSIGYGRGANFSVYFKL